MSLHGRVSGALAAVWFGFCALLGGWTPAMTTLIVIAALDVISGLARSYIQKTLSSKVSWVGGIRKVMMFVVICLAAQIDPLVGSAPLLRNAVVIFYCVSEGLSVVENTVAAGLPVPEFLRDALSQLNERKANPNSDAS